MEEILNNIFFKLGKIIFKWSYFTTRIGNCGICAELVDKICDTCRARNKQTIHYRANITQLKMKPPNENGQMVPY